MIKERFGLEPVTRAGSTGQFQVNDDGETIAERGGNWLAAVTLTNSRSN